LSRRGSVEEAAINEETKELAEKPSLEKPSTSAKTQAERKDVAVGTSPPAPEKMKVKPPQVPENVTKPSASQAVPPQADSPKQEGN
jgi:hypothetical protein